MKHTWRRLARRLGWDHNPLRRRIDRAESVTMSVMLAIFVLAGPALSVVAGRMTDAAGLREQLAEQSWVQRPATLLQGAADQAASSDEWGAAWVPASWTAPDGQHRTGLVATALNARAGQRVEEWMTPTGQLVRPRLTAADVRDEVAFAVLSMLIGLALVLGLAAAVLQLLFNRRRIAGWQRAWDAVGPHWSRQQ